MSSLRHNPDVEFQKIADVICPTCQGELVKSPESFTCRQCGALYQVVQNVPLLYRKDHQIIFEPPPVGMEVPLKLKLDFLKPIFSLKKPLATRSNLRYLRQELTDSARLLILGGGWEHFGWFIKELGADRLKRAVNLEVCAGPLVDLAADAHELPFPDHSFDAIICQSVLEHTKNAPRVVSEMHRILRPGGLVFAEVPFLQPVHMTSDFQRYTLLGLEHLFSEFETLRCGVNGGIAAAFTATTVYFLATLLSFNSSRLYRAWKLLFRVLFAPVKFLDPLLVGFSTTALCASENYYIGRKKPPAEAAHL